MRSLHNLTEFDTGQDYSKLRRRTRQACHGSSATSYFGYLDKKLKAKQLSCRLSTVIDSAIDMIPMDGRVELCGCRSEIRSFFQRSHETRLKRDEPTDRIIRWFIRQFFSFSLVSLAIVQQTMGGPCLVCSSSL